MPTKLFCLTNGTEVALVALLSVSQARAKNKLQPRGTPYLWLPMNGRQFASVQLREEGVCRECGCTDDDCSGCVERTGQACHWVDIDLCSACVPVGAEKEITLSRFFRVKSSYYQFLPPVPPEPDDADWTSRMVRRTVITGALGADALKKVKAFPSVKEALAYINALPF